VKISQAIFFSILAVLVSCTPASAQLNANILGQVQMPPNSVLGNNQPVTGGLNAIPFSALSSALISAGPQTFPTNNTANALTLTTPNPTSVTYDTTPLAALFINQPAAPTTRAFLSGIWVQTNAATTDKGRGIGINNLGASDGLYIQNDGVGSTGFASLLTQLATTGVGGVIGTTLAGHTGLIVRQETTINPSAASATLLQVQADGSATEMLRLSSTGIAGQVGLIARLTGANATPIVILNPSLVNTFQVNNNGGIISGVNGGASGILLMNGSTSGSSSLSVNATGSLTIDGAAGLSVTKTVRAAGGAADCTLIFTKGLLTGGSC